MSEQQQTQSERTGASPRWNRSMKVMLGAGARPLRAVLVALMFLAFVPAIAFAQNESGLNSKQEALSSRYSRFEKLLLQMAEYLGRTDPDRAELLMRALSRSREERISTRMNSIVELLQNEDFDEALEGQEQLVGNLRQLLELLQSEDRRSELEEEAARIRKMLKDVNKLIGDQKIARATASRSGKPSDGIKSQQRVADKTQKIIDAAKQADEKNASEENAAPQAENANGEPKDGPNGKKSDGDAPKDPKSDGSQSKDGDPNQSKDGAKPNGKSQEGQPKSGQPQSGQPQQGQPKSGQPQNGESQQGEQQEQKKSPGREELEEAQQAMERAIEQLKQEQKEGSEKEQDEALDKLLTAKEKLEEKLRQLREEERELTLAKLEARLQKMLAMQVVINSGTTALAGTPQDQWLGRDFDRSRQLAQLEADVAIEASKTLTVLKEEGTSVSFPLAVEDVREDVNTVARRLDDGNVGELTQEIQTDIVDALREMVLALQKEMEKGDEKQQGQQQQQQMAPQNNEGDPVLVELLAEMRMLRTLQLRINRRTKQIGREIKNGDQAQKPELLEQLERLAERQERIRQTAIDIARTRKQKP